MKGPSRTICAKLREPIEGHELVVGFEDNENDIIETQFDPLKIEGLTERAEALKAVLCAKGWIEIPLDPSSEVDYDERVAKTAGAEGGPPISY